MRTLDDERDLEHSPLPGPFTRDGVTVEVETYRYAGTQDPWRLEVIDQKGGCTGWHERFTTELDAYRAFAAVVEDDGIASFATAPPKVRH